MPFNLPVLAAGLLVVSASAVAGVAADSGDDKMTICHMPHGDPAGARTLQVSRSSWSGHQGHGDHQGACTDADRRAHPPTSPSGPATRVALDHDEGEGHLDGDASFKVVVLNHGAAPATGVQLAGTLGGDGRWSLRSDVPGCTLAKGRLACDLGSLPAESSVTLRLEYDGHPDVCREVAIDLALTAANDATGGDDRAKESVHVGACAPLDRSAAEASASAPESAALPGSPLA